MNSRHNHNTKWTRVAGYLVPELNGEYNKLPERSLVHKSSTGEQNPKARQMTTIVLVGVCNLAYPDAGRTLTCTGPQGLAAEERLLGFVGCVVGGEARQEERGDSSKDA